MQGTDKTALLLLGRPVFLHSLEAFEGLVDCVVGVVGSQEQRQYLAEYVKDKGIYWAYGGPRRQDSVLNGLRALPRDVERVLVHDAARPLVRPEAIAALLEALSHSPAACLAAAVTDSLVWAQDGYMQGPLERHRVWATQTPQGAQRQALEAALEAFSQNTFTDEAAALYAAGHKVSLVPNPYPNPKITYPADIAMIESLLTRLDRHKSR